jgi:hypothetical protein
LSVFTWIQGKQDVGGHVAGGVADVPMLGDLPVAGQAVATDHGTALGDPFHETAHARR